MKADGKSAKGGSDQDDKEDFGEAFGRSNGSEDRFGRRFLGCVEERIEIARKSIRQFGGEI
jgi:hypothetical protein